MIRKNTIIFFFSGFYLLRRLCDGGGRRDDGHGGEFAAYTTSLDASEPDEPFNLFELLEDPYVHKAASTEPDLDLVGEVGIVGAEMFEGGLHGGLLVADPGPCSPHFDVEADDFLFGSDEAEVLVDDDADRGNGPWLVTDLVA